MAEALSQMNKKPLMIRTAAIVLICAFAFALFSGCSGNNKDTDNETPQPIVIGNPTPNPGETVTDAPTEAPQQTAEITSEPTQAAENSPVPTENASEQPTEQPTQKPTEVPATEPPVSQSPVTDAPVGDPTYVSIGTSSHPARFTMPTDLYGIPESTCEQWFSDAVFVGDSVTLGWKNYNNYELQTNPNFFGKTHFLCSGSYGVGHAFDPISESSLHPIYHGEQHYVWDSIQMMGVNKVFILFGLNDLSIWGVDGTAERYEQLLDNIKASCPNVQIFVISAMYMYRGSEREKLNNRNLYLLNQRLVGICNAHGYEFINIASHLIDENGFVPDEYSSDHYVHQTYAAYAIWAQILRSTAARHISGRGPVVFTLP